MIDLNELEKRINDEVDDGTISFALTSIELLHIVNRAIAAEAKLAEIEKQEPVKGTYWRDGSGVFTNNPRDSDGLLYLRQVQKSPAVAVPEEETNFCALKSITDSQVNAVARAFWRRIYAYRNDYGIELPKPLPVEFMAHMATALTWVDKGPSTRITEQDAREIVKNYMKHNWSTYIKLTDEAIDVWINQYGRTLLAKLNEHREPDYKTQNEIYLSALKEIACLGNGDKYGNSDGNVIAQKAIAKASASTDNGEKNV